ncbi:hypothetical protein Y032_0077g1099 [Ancylostoma ceylanicum]|nr:hypothetical protein Y032_0077g1099 [Ancylostoma ceylanicum]
MYLIISTADPPWGYVGSPCGMCGSTMGSSGTADPPRECGNPPIYWETQPCNKGLQYVCQIAPCDSTNYCSEPLSAHRQMHRMYMHPKAN